MCLFINTVDECLGYCSKEPKDLICALDEKGYSKTLNNKCVYECYEKFRGYKWVHGGGCKGKEDKGDKGDKGKTPTKSKLIIWTHGICTGIRKEFPRSRGSQLVL